MALGDTTVVWANERRRAHSARSARPVTRVRGSGHAHIAISERCRLMNGTDSMRQRPAPDVATVHPASIATQGESRCLVEIALTCTGAQSCTAQRAIEPLFGRKLFETGGAVRRTLSETERTRWFDRKFHWYGDLRVRPKSSRDFAKSSKHQPNGRQAKERHGGPI
jgi:hypothetical protein